MNFPKNLFSPVVLSPCELTEPAGRSHGLLSFFPRSCPNSTLRSFILLSLFGYAVDSQINSTSFLLNRFCFDFRKCHRFDLFSFFL